ncbi:SsrA-binding protein SmpB [Candidatus Dojkabacteria bacterium]|nr:SsrA-binding protein SmpB [Candidatus Dojkabacteria bacterium]
MTRKKYSKKTAAKSSSKPSRGVKIFARNRKAFYNYEVIDRYEAGIVLTGAEVKSIKSGNVSLAESFIQVEKGEVWLWNCHIGQWIYSGDMNYDPIRKRKLLLNKKEITQLGGKSREKGMTLIPIRLYAVRGKIKVEIGLCRGKKKYEKKQKEKERMLNKEMHEIKRKYMV